MNSIMLILFMLEYTYEDGSYMGGAEELFFDFRNEPLQHPRHSFETDDIGLILSSTIDSFISECGKRCNCSSPCPTNDHHLIFDASEVEARINDLAEPQDRAVYYDFYQSPFAKITLPICEHDFIQNNTHSMEFPQLNTMRALLDELSIARGCVSVLRNHRSTYKRFLDLHQGRAESIRELRSDIGRFSHYSYIRKEIGHSRYHTKGRLNELQSKIDDSNLMLTKKNLTNAGSTVRLARALSASRILRNVAKGNDRFVAPYEPQRFSF